MDNNQRINTSTQIRNIYSQNMSYINIKFYNNNLSFQFFPFVSKDPTGKSNYDQQKGLMTTVSYAAAFSLHQAAMEIISGKYVQKSGLLIQCAGGATLFLERKLGPNNVMETFFTINKNGTIIPFKFETQVWNVEENGQMVDKVIESGLGMFAKTLNGYLEGINADRHLDKMTEDYIKSLGDKANNQPGQFQTNTSYQKKPYNPNYKKPYKPYNNNYNQNQSWENNQQPAQQSMSDYQIPN